MPSFRPRSNIAKCPGHLRFEVRWDAGGIPVEAACMHLTPNSMIRALAPEKLRLYLELADLLRGVQCCSVWNAVCGMRYAVRWSVVGVYE